MRIEYIARHETFEEFLERHGLEAVAKERPGFYSHERRISPWYCVLEPRVEILVEGTLIGIHGNGGTPEGAYHDLKARLRGRKIVINAYRKDRREIQCPNGWKVEV